MKQDLSTPIEFLKGVGPQRAALLAEELGISQIGHLLQHFPFRYVDRSRIHSIEEVNDEMTFVQLKGTLSQVAVAGKGRGSRLTAKLTDATGSIDLVWFKGIRWVQPNLKSGKEYLLFGRPTRYRDRLNIAHPELELAASAKVGLQTAMQPVYNTTEKLSARGLNSRGIEKLMRSVLPLVKGRFPETLSPKMVDWLGGLSKEQAIVELHAPHSSGSLHTAKQRLKFEELFFVQLSLLMQKRIAQNKVKGIPFQDVETPLQEALAQSLPFQLTDAQKRVLAEMNADLTSGKQMNRLLQGDVGSGKTVVALMAIMMALDSGAQACLMAPTEILAKQHFSSISKMLESLPIRVGLLTGSSKAVERRPLHEALESGNMDLVIGTHALLEDKVKFKHLGLVVIDEQHRFGVAQRARLWKKNTQPPHVLVMTATPIPRTLAMTFYGDLDVSVIDQLPPGRKPIRTVLRSDATRPRVFQFLEDEITKGRQVYVVYPLIQESETMDLKDLMDGYESISRRFPKPEYQISIVHGKMKVEDKDHEMGRFLRKETQILVATTVIEVGVDVPNASVMVIESAERFGLSQLHQLRGRVGRGAEQSYCILMSGFKLTQEARTRLQTMVDSNDGFHIAEVDLDLRGPGNIMGTRQSGDMDFKHADLALDQKLLTKARQTAIRLLELDPKLSLPENAPIAIHLSRLLETQRKWSRIS